MTPYPKIRKRFHAMASLGAALHHLGDDGQGWYQADWFPALMQDMVAIAQSHNMQITSCAMEQDLARYGVCPGKCIDEEYIASVFGLGVSHEKDPGQRTACGCVVSRDVGMYDTCLFGCQYCYATRSFERARANHAAHQVESPSMLGWHEAACHELNT